MIQQPSQHMTRWAPFPGETTHEVTVLAGNTLPPGRSGSCRWLAGSQGQSPRPERREQFALQDCVPHQSTVLRQQNRAPRVPRVLDDVSTN